MERNFKMYLKLFSSTFQLSMFTLGGGYVIVPLMKKHFVDKLKWIDEEEMLDMVAVAQSGPGAMAINTSILVGYQVGGIPGAAVSLLGTILPPLLIIMVISFFYTAFKTNQVVAAVLRGMGAGVSAVIADVVFDMSYLLVKKKRILSILIAVAAFIATFVFGINVAFIILACGLLGGIMAFIKSRRRDKK